MSLSNVRIMTEEEWINLLPEVEWYQGKADAVHGDGMAERKRVVSSLNCFVALTLGDYEWLTKNQDQHQKLTSETFQRLSKSINNCLTTHLVAPRVMLVIMALHDLFKIAAVKEKFPANNESDHDELLAVALKNSPEGFPSLSEDIRDQVTQVLSLSLSLLQFVQGECGDNKVRNAQKVAISSPKTFDLYWLFELLDLAGAMGHIHSEGSPVLTELTVISFLAAVDSIKNATGNAYQNYLNIRYKMALPSSDWAFGRIKPTEHIGFCRLLCMARLNKPGDALILAKALDGMNYGKRSAVLSELSYLDGLTLYYSPQLLVNQLEKKCDDAMETKLKHILELLYECYRAIDSATEIKPVYYLTDLVNYCKANNLPDSLYVEGDKILWKEKVAMSSKNTDV